MKRLVTALAIIFVAVVFVAIGCTNTNLIGPSPGEGQGVVSSCVFCHTDKTLLKEVASLEPLEEASETSSGEG